MSSRAEIDNDAVPPVIRFPRRYNVAAELIDSHVPEGRGDKPAFIDDHGTYTYRELSERVNRAGNALLGLGMEPESRVLLCLHDGIEFLALFFGGIKAGIVTIPLNTLLTTEDYGYILEDSRARTLIVSEPLLRVFAPVLASSPHLRHVVVAGGAHEGHAALEPLLQAASPRLEPAATSPDEVAFWLYTSGSTGRPKGVMHLHRDPVYTAVHYARGVLDLREEDVVFSAAKLFFAYGLGNSATFPLYVGATAVVMAERPTPQSVMGVIERHQPTVFFGVPTLYAALLAEAGIVRSEAMRLRLCISAGEALPEAVGTRWEERFDVAILDGLGSTEMLHIFLSNTPDDVHYGTTGRAVGGYELRVLDEHDQPAAPDAIGELVVRGGSAAMAYWNQREKSLATFQGPWTRTGDQYTVSADGLFTYCGRNDDMLKVGGIWVSPFEVESALLAHERVVEAGVVGREDEHGLVKPQAFVVLDNPVDASPGLAESLQQFVKTRLAPYKYPRWIEFVAALPKTATGKVQRFKLRETASRPSADP